MCFVFKLPYFPSGIQFCCVSPNKTRFLLKQQEQTIYSNKRRLQQKAAGGGDCPAQHVLTFIVYNMQLSSMCIITSQALHCFLTYPCALLVNVLWSIQAFGIVTTEQQRQFPQHVSIYRTMSVGLMLAFCGKRPSLHHRYFITTTATITVTTYYYCCCYLLLMIALSPVSWGLR